MCRPVGDGGVVHGDPRPAQRAVAGRDVLLVLMPGLPGLARTLHEQHRLHALHRPVPVRQMRADDLRKDAADRRMLAELLHHRADEVRLVDAQDAVQHLLVGDLRVSRFQLRTDVAAAGQLEHVGLQLGQLGRVDQAWRPAEAVVDKAPHLGWCELGVDAAGGAAGRRSLVAGRWSQVAGGWSLGADGRHGCSVDSRSLEFRTFIPMPGIGPCYGCM